MMEILKMVCLIMWSFAGAAFTIGILYSLVWMNKWYKSIGSMWTNDKDNEI